eukprot:c24214_g7_i1 orf=3-1859(-)
MSLHSQSTSKLLPTLSSASSTPADHHKLSKGYCTGLFFHLCYWNCRPQKRRLFRQKSLPAERLDSLAPKDHTREDERLYAAQIFHISDGGSIPHDLGSKAEDGLQEDRTPETKRKKRRLNVVAKLMGLETMPSPDLQREKRPIQDQRSMPIPSFEGISNSRMPSSRRSLMEVERGAVDNFSLRRGFTTASPSHDPCIGCDESILPDMPCDATTHNGQACRVPTMLEAAPCEKNRTFRCILSPSGTHNKMFLPVKSPMDAAKATVCMIEAADRILQASRQPRNTLIRSQPSRQVLPVGNSEKENNKKAMQKKSSSSKTSSYLCVDNSAPYCGPKQGRKIDNAGSFPATSRPHAASQRQTASSSSSSAANENIKGDAAVQQLKRGLGVNDDKDSAKWIWQGAQFGKGEKEKPCPKRQEQSSRRLREVNSSKLQNATPVIAKLERDPSPPKCTSTLEPHGTSSARSILSTVTQSKSTSSRSAAISKNKRLSSSSYIEGDKKSTAKPDKAESRLNSLPAMKSLSTRRRAGSIGFEGPISRRNSAISKHKDVDNKSSSEHEGDNLYMGEMGEDCELSASAEVLSTSMDSVNLSSDVSIAQDACRSSSGDIGSSCDINSTHRRKQ